MFVKLQDKTTLQACTRAKSLAHTIVLMVHSAKTRYI